MKLFNYLILLLICSTGPILLNAQAPIMGGTATHISWDAPICTKIPGMKNRITWTTAETVPTKYYEVLRSSDGINFKTIGSVEAGSQNITNYLFEDAQPLSTAYYQICSVSLFGLKTFSAKIKAVTSTGNTMVRQGYNSATLVFKDNAARVITVVNLNGQQMKTISSTGVQYTINTNSMSKGIYVVKIDTEGVTDVQKIMVL